MILLDGLPLPVYPQAGMTIRHFLDPRKRSENEEPDSIWWALTDSFDAVTNGMQNPQAFAALLAHSDPELSSWKLLLDAITALYRGDREGCRLASQAMGRDDPLYPLSAVFRLWLSDAEPSMASSDEVAEEIVSLYRKLIIPVHPLALLAGQAEEALRQGLLERFDAIAYRLFMSLEEGNPSSVLSMKMGLHLHKVALSCDICGDLVLASFERACPQKALLLHCLTAICSASKERALRCLELLENSFPPLCDRALCELLRASLEDSQAHAPAALSPSASSMQGPKQCCEPLTQLELAF